MLFYVPEKVSHPFGPNQVYVIPCVSYSIPPRQPRPNVCYSRFLIKCTAPSILTQCMLFYVPDIVFPSLWHGQAKSSPAHMYLSEFFKAALVPMGVFPTEVDVTEKMMVPESVGQGKLDTMSPLEVKAAFHRRLRSLHSSQQTPMSSKKPSLATRLQFATPPMGISKYRFLMFQVSLHVRRVNPPLI